MLSEAVKVLKYKYLVAAIDKYKMDQVGVVFCFSLIIHPSSLPSLNTPPTSTSTYTSTSTSTN